MDLRVGEVEVRGLAGGTDCFLRNGNFIRDGGDGSPCTALEDSPRWWEWVVCETDSHSCSETRLGLEALTDPLTETLTSPMAVKGPVPFFFKSRLWNIPKSGI